MEVKGTAVKSVFEYMEDKQNAYLNDWLTMLSVESREIFENPILATKWYDLDTAVINPMKLAAWVLKLDEKELAWEMGVYSSVVALKGIYKVFIRISSTNFIISRAANITTTYYKNSEVKVLDSEKNKVTLELLKFPKEANLIMYRIGGWVQNTFYAVGCKNVKVEVKNIDDYYEFKTILIVTWD